MEYLEETLKELVKVAPYGAIMIILGFIFAWINNKSMKNMKELYDSSLESVRRAYSDSLHQVREALAAEIHKEPLQNIVDKPSVKSKK